jgi:peptidyl-tRNA hydrolase, PTH1 family
MLVFAGLGNPGAKHARNRHNVGYMAADAIARRHSFPRWSKKFQSEAAEGTIGGEKVLLIKPQTFMNLSGQAVREAMRFHKLGPDRLVVFYDELDLAPGRVRVKTGGGAGGHNGIRSIDGHLPRDYRRVRIGIGHPGAKELVTRHVLGDFDKADQEWLEPLLDAIAGNADLLVRGDEAGFMNKVAVASGAGTVKPGAGAPAPKQQSHIRQAPPPQPPVKAPEIGPMAAMLKRLFGSAK